MAAHGRTEPNGDWLRSTRSGRSEKCPFIGSFQGDIGRSLYRNPNAWSFDTLGRAMRETKPEFRTRTQLFEGFRRIALLPLSENCSRITRRSAPRAITCALPWAIVRPNLHSDTVVARLPMPTQQRPTPCFCFTQLPAKRCLSKISIPFEPADIGCFPWCFARSVLCDVNVIASESFSSIQRMNLKTVRLRRLGSQVCP
jgi:hypothetical protein